MAPFFLRRNAVIDEIVSRLSKPNASAEESGTAATLVFGSMSPSPQRDTSVAQLEHQLIAVQQAKGRHDPR